MSSTPRFRVIGVAAGLAVFALVAGFFLLSQGQSSSTGATTHRPAGASSWLAPTTGWRRRRSAHLPQLSSFRAASLRPPR